ncbi:MAG: archaellin/type IV pilin N-terminal domain-containing protein [Nanoarchaeota archaeon]
MNKKALSPVIASAFLIALVCVLAVIVYTFSKSFIAEQIQKFDQPIESVCGQVNFKAELKTELGQKYLKLANYGNIPIYNFDLKEIEGGNSEVQTFDFFLDSGESKEEKLSLKNINSNEVIIYPKVLGRVKDKTTNKAFTCLDQGQSFNLQ